MQCMRHSATIQQVRLICSWRCLSNVGIYMHHTQVPHRVFIYSMYIDTQLDGSMQVRNMPLGEIFSSGWKARG